jgi:hypothetical protein
MSWSITASGHAGDPQQEKILAGRLGQVLAEAGPAVGGASFSGSAYSGDPRELAEISLEAPAPGTEAGQ